MQALAAHAPGSPVSLRASSVRFCINRLTAIWPGAPGRWAGVLVSSVVFGLMHYYQGPSGVVSIGIMGLASAVFYVRRGRIWPLIVAHALYDAVSIGFAMVMIARSTAGSR